MAFIILSTTCTGSNIVFNSFWYVINPFANSYIDYRSLLPLLLNDTDIMNTISFM